MECSWLREVAWASNTFGIGSKEVTHWQNVQYRPSAVSLKKVHTSHVFRGFAFFDAVFAGVFSDVVRFLADTWCWGDVMLWWPTQGEPRHLILDATMLLLGLGWAKVSAPDDSGVCGCRRKVAGGALANESPLWKGFDGLSVIGWLRTNE